MKKADAPKHERMESGAMLITGCPRSATRSVTQYFEEHGVSLGHETAGEKGTVEWRHAYTEDADFVIQMTLVRDPLDTVRSLAELLTNCDRNSDTWTSIKELSIAGGWYEKLMVGDYLFAAVDWWTTVYERLYDFPLLRMEHLPKLPQTNRHRRVNRDADMGRLLKGCTDFWRVAKMYGYYTEKKDGE
jgi:hypothetical protein